MQLTAFDPVMAIIRHYDFAEAARNTDYYKKIIPAMRDYFETDHYVFVHGWIPCMRERNGYSYYSDWRSASAEEWAKARWYNGIDAAVTCQEEKTIVCGHWHTSYGHAKYEGKGSEFDDDADFSPYRAPGIIDKYEEEALEALGITLRDEEGNQRPSEVIVQEFKERLPTFTPEQQMYAALIILLIHKRHF